MVLFIIYAVPTESCITTSSYNNKSACIPVCCESTRPNATKITTEEEIKRVIPLIEKIRKENINIPISIDTRNYLTAKKAIEAGANVIVAGTSVFGAPDRKAAIEELRK